MVQVWTRPLGLPGTFLKGVVATARLASVTPFGERALSLSSQGVFRFGGVGRAKGVVEAHIRAVNRSVTQTPRSNRSAASDSGEQEIAVDSSINIWEFPKGVPLSFVQVRLSLDCDLLRVPDR